MFAVFFLHAAPTPASAGLLVEDREPPLFAEIAGKTLHYMYLSGNKYEVVKGENWKSVEEDYKEIGTLDILKDGSVRGEIYHYASHLGESIIDVMRGSLREGSFRWTPTKPNDNLETIEGTIVFSEGSLVVEWPRTKPFRRTTFKLFMTALGLQCNLWNELIANQGNLAVLELDGFTFRYQPAATYNKSDCFLRDR